jgi:hypothetical protein
MDFKWYRHIFSKNAKTIRGHSACFRKIYNFLLVPIIYFISMTLPLPNSETKHCIRRSTFFFKLIVDYLCPTCNLKLLVSDITWFYPLIKTVDIMLWPYHIAQYSWSVCNLGPEPGSFRVFDCSTNVSGTQYPPSLHKILVKPLSREFITLKISVGIKYYLTNVL